MMSVMGWVTDGILVLLLLGTLVMAIRLDRALRVVRRDRGVFEALITNLSAATSAVKLGIQELRNEAEQAADQIGRRSEEADRMATDLSFLIEAADRAGATLEQRLKAVPAAPVPAAPAPVQAAQAPKADADDGEPPEAQASPKRRRAKATARPRTAPTPGPQPHPAPEAPAYHLAGVPAEWHTLAGITTKRGAVAAMATRPPAQAPTGVPAAATFDKAKPRREGPPIAMAR